MSESEKKNFSPSSKAAAAGGYYFDDDDEEDEAEFDPNNDGDTNTSSSEDDDDNDDEFENGEASASIVILSGSLTFNEEGHVVYSGTWHVLGHDESMNSTNKETSYKKFKLKSNSKPAAFDFLDPTSDMKSRSLLFHGSFDANPSRLDEDEEHQSKIKEKDVEITFTEAREDLGSPSHCFLKHHDTSSNNITTKIFHVTGSGSNEYGPFSIKGEYRVKVGGGSSVSNSDQQISNNTLICEKTYIPQPTQRQTKKRSRNKYLSDDDDDYDSDDDGADLEELAALHEEACMSVEELCQRYEVTANYEAASDDDRKPAAAKRKIEDDEDRKPSAKNNKQIADEEDRKPPANKKNRHKSEESEDEYTF